MRLTADECLAIERAARATLQTGTRVSLFGSRVDDARRGGDIDLIVETPASLPAPEFVQRRQRLLAMLQVCWMSAGSTSGRAGACA